MKKSLLFLSLMLIPFPNLCFAVSPITCDIGVLEALARYQKEQYVAFSKASGELANISKVEFVHRDKKKWLKLSGTNYPAQKKCSAKIFYTEDDSNATFGCPPVKITTITNDC